MTERFEHSKHGAQLASWLSAWGISPDADPILPPTGLVVPGAAMCWLFRTDSGQAYIDRLITNPEITDSVRDEVVLEVLSALEGIARREGFTAVTALASTANMALRFERLGFIRSPGSFAFYSKRLKETV